ncbi:membrane bound O-acyl transferase family-domain-containing protein [Melampsora americana]|nr:membrane bound O-acyl transferase family-domain-containing protein [Melampsora americana]
MFDSFIKTFRFPEESVTCQFPSYGLIVRLFPLWIQCSLLHLKFSKSSSLKSLRFLITPINIFLALSIPIDYCFLPRTKSGLLNLYLSVWSFHYATKALEWGLTSGHSAGKYWARPVSEYSLLKSDVGVGRPAEKDNDSWREVIVWTTEQFFSPRGLQYGWGLKIQPQASSVLRMLRRLFVVNLVMSASLAFLLLTREKGSPSNALAAIGIPEFKSKTILAEGLGTLSYGLFLISAIDTMFTQFHILCHVIHWLAEFVPIPSFILRILNPTLAHPVFNSPHTVTSLGEFWGKGWHQLFRKSFLVCGALPASGLARKLGGGMKVQKICGLFGAFLVSGVMHEYIIHGVAHKPHPSPHVYFKEFPSTFLYFLVQPIGIILEPFIIPHIPRRMGGGWTWVLLFTLLTATPFRKQYAENFRLIDDGFKPLGVWNLKTILIPGLLYNF